MKRQFIDLDENADFLLPRGENLIAFYARPAVARSMLKKPSKIVQLLVSEAERRGYETYFVAGSADILDELSDDPSHFHIARFDRPFRAPNLVHIVPSYVHGYWYVDGKGVRNKSSLGSEAFSPEKIDKNAAQKFAEILRDKFIRGNFSKWPQAEIGSEYLQNGSAVLFLQSDKLTAWEERYIERDALIEASIKHRGDRKLYIKPHPRASIAEQEEALAFHDPDAGVEVSLASVHDLLAHADFMITQSSAVALEAQMHHVPAILSGETDFHHNAITIKEASEMGDAIARAINAPFFYDEYLYWFLHENMIATEPLSEDVLWRRLAKMGMPLAREIVG